jgi:L-malate glycosyltransferase
LEGVEFKGNVLYEEMPLLFSESSIFVHGTKFESFGIVLIEAMASGTPIVSTNVGGIPDVIVDGEEGFLVDYGDSMAMGKNIIELHENEELYNKLRVNGKNKASQYGEEALAPDLINLLSQLIK